MYTYIHRYTYTYIHIHIYNGNIHAYLFYKIQFQWPQSTHLPLCYLAKDMVAPPAMGWQRTARPGESNGKTQENTWKSNGKTWKSNGKTWKPNGETSVLNMIWMECYGSCPPAPFFPSPEKPQKTVVQWSICMKKQHRPRGSNIFRGKKMASNIFQPP